MLGIKNYNPIMYTNVSNLIENYRIQLEGLIGKTIQKIWVAWEQDQDEWFNDCPVIICFDECQLELCAYKMDEFAVTFDKILVSQKLCWYGTDLKLNWEENKMEDLHDVRGKKVMEIEMIERRETNATEFYLAGMGFHLNNGYFAICNGLDENVIIKHREESPNYKYTTI